MAASKNENPFLLPKRVDSSKYKGEFSIKTLKQWIDRLPVSDVEKGAFDLHGKLDRLNTINISPANRFEILELLQPSIDYITNSLKKGLLEGSLPLGIRKRMIAELRLDILIQATKGYKCVLSQLHDSSVTSALFHKQTKADALRGAVYYLGEILLHSYIIYQPCVSFTWKELHGIFYYAVQNEIKGDLEAGRESGQLGFDGLYKQILLLALANPKSMLKGEAERVNVILQELVAFVDLESIGSTSTAESYYIVDAQSDEMPCAPNLQRDEKVNVGWYLVTDNIWKIMDEKISAAELSQNSMRPTDAETLRLMRKLRDAWSNQIRPRELRNSVTDMVELVCGLDSIYQANGGEEPNDTASWKRQLNIALYSSGYHTIGSPILDNDEVLIEVEPGTLEPYRSTKGVAWHNPMRGRKKIDGKECVATNRSEKGYRLNWPDSGDEGTHVGELVGITANGRDGDKVVTSCGVIRWLYADQPGFLDMGVELFHGKLEPVILQCVSENKQWTETIKGFLQHADSGDESSLITPPFYVTKKDRIRIVTGNDDVPVNITNIIESTDSFVRFKFEPSSEASYAY